MAVHMFRCCIGAGPMAVADLDARIDDWVASNAVWDGDSSDHTLTEVNTEPDGSGATYHAIPVRFLLDDAKDNLLQKFTDKLVNKVGWYRVGYHSCTHDEETTYHDATDSFVAELDKTVSLSNDRITPHSEVVRGGNGSTAIPEAEYQMDYEIGTLTAGPLDGMESGTRYYVDYEYAEGGGPCSWDDEVEWAASGVSIPSGVPTFP